MIAKTTVASAIKRAFSPWICLSIVIGLSIGPSRAGDVTDIFEPGFAFQPPQGTTVADPISAPAPVLASAARLLINGEASFTRRMELIDEAQQSIYIQALIYKGDAVGIAIADALIAKKKANPQMDIRLIVDAYSNIQDLQAQLLFFELQNHGISVEGYEAFYLQWLNEVNLKDWLAGNKRYHEKYWIVDGAKAVVGGMNIADEYARWGDDPLLRWRDQDVYLEGPVVAQIEAAFLDNCDHFKEIKAAWPQPLSTDTYWDAWSGVNPAFKGLVGTTMEKARGRVTGEGADLAQLKARRGQGSPLRSDVPVRFVRSRPRLNEDYIEQLYVHLIDSAETSVLIQNAYFVPTPRLFDALVAAAKRGVSVTVITNSRESNDITLISDAGRTHYLELLQAGVAVLEWHGERHGESTIHSKFAVFDLKVPVIGSYNFDPRSLALNSEDVVALDSPAMAQELASYVMVEEVPLCDRITTTQAKAWADPRSLPKMDENPPIWSDPRFDPDLYEYFLLKQVEGSL